MKVKKPDYILAMEQKFAILFDNFYNVALNIFKWTNLPKGLTSEYIEKKLFNRGSLLFYNSKKANGLLCLPADKADDLNVYEYPLKYRVTGHNFWEDVNADDGILIKNNALKSPTRKLVTFWLEHIIDIFSAFKVNLNWSKTPFILSGTKEQMLTMQNLVEQITGNKPAIFVDKSLSDLTTLDLKQTGTAYIGDKLLDAYDRLEDKLLTFLGINNTNTTKRERLVVDEVNSNNDEIENNLDTFFSARKEAVEEINKKFGTNIKVEVNQTYVKAMRELAPEKEKQNFEEKDGGENE